MTNRWARFRLRRCGLTTRASISVAGNRREGPRRLKRDKGLSMLVVDILQLITARGRFGNRQEEVASISRSLKGLAKELQISGAGAQPIDARAGAR